MPTFAAKGGISTLVLHKLNEGNTVESQQLYDLLKRPSNCNYEQQVLAGLEEGADLYQKIIDDVKTTGLIQTDLPCAKRHLINTGVTLGHSSLNVANDVDDPTPIVFEGPPALIVSAYQMKEPSYTVTDHLFEFTRSKDLILNFKASLSIYDGSSKVGSTHPAATWRFSNPVDNAVTFGVDLVLIVGGGGEEVVPLTTGTFFKENIQDHDVFSIYASKRIKILVPTQQQPLDSFNEPVYTGFYLRVYRSPYVATFNGAGNHDKMGFIMEGALSAPNVDTSNFLEIIELSSIGD